MLEQQQKLVLSKYTELYDLIISKDNMLRQIKELINFDFVYDELIDKYCLDNGRNAVSPIRMFKYLLLKTIYNISDVDVVERSKYDMSFKYFLDMAPEEGVINASSLTKFRKMRLKDMNLLDMLIGKTVEIALEKGIIETKSIIVDSTHTRARYNKKSPREALQEQSKKLRRVIYEVDETIKEKLPAKNMEDSLEKELEYCNELISKVRENEVMCAYPKVQEKLNLLEEMVTDETEYIELSKDKDARTGYKSAEKSFFGYKTHIAMSEERIITAATVTSGEKHDGKQLETLVKKSREAGMTVETVIGDKAYSSSDNIEDAKKGNYELVSRMINSVTNGKKRTKNDEFEFNKDADTYQCKAGHLAKYKYLCKKKSEKEPTRISYYFDVKKCKVCPYRDGCYKEGSRYKIYKVTIMGETHSEHAKFQETEYFKEKVKERYKIEAKNSELKNRHGYDIASSSGLANMEMQGALTIFTVNIKRILKLMNENNK